MLIDEARPLSQLFANDLPFEIERFFSVSSRKIVSTADCGNISLFRSEIRCMSFCMTVFIGWVIRLYCGVVRVSEMCASATIVNIYLGVFFYIPLAVLRCILITERSSGHGTQFLRSVGSSTC